MTATLCVCGKFHTDQEFKRLNNNHHTCHTATGIICDDPYCYKFQCLQKREEMAILNQTEKKPSTSLDIALVCGCTLRERFEFYKSKTPRNFKTLLRRVYDREEDQSFAIKGKTFVNLVANPSCTKHWIKPIPKPVPVPFLSDIRQYLSAMSLTRSEADFLHREVESRVNR